MRHRSVHIALGHDGPRRAQELTLYRSDLRRLVRSGAIVRHLGRYASATIETDDVSFPRAPLAAPLVARLLAPRSIAYVDAAGVRRALPWRFHVIALLAFLRDLVTIGSAQRRLRALQRLVEDGARRSTPSIQGRVVAYVRTDLVFGLAAGGSVGHIAGVVNNLRRCGYTPWMVTTDRIPTVDADIEISLIRPEARYWNHRRLPRHYFNVTHLDDLLRLARQRPIGWMYHRSSLGSLSAGVAALKLNLPLVLEYNGSEVWAEANWGRGGADEFDAAVELAMLRLADVIVVVSEPLRDELATRGIDESRVTVIPNGVDVDRYRPDVPPARFREEDPGDVVIGFIGTFGPWHGAEVLAEAFEELCMATDRPVHLLLIGEGARRPATLERLARSRARERVTFTGLVPQADGPAYLAACDVLVAPHVPNPDGSPFFGSPTKLFEYMAMGRCIVASALEQIADVLDHERTALLVEPGNASDLGQALARAVSDADLRARLGANARAEVVARHTWASHTERIVEALERRCGGSS